MALLIVCAVITVLAIARARRNINRAARAERGCRRRGGR